ncbi:MAG TPA: diguanylate cyclase [Moraxellaceae bacterium]
MSTPVTQEAIDLELREIQGLLDAPSRFLRLSPRLEADFRRHMQNRSIEILRHGWWTILLFYLAVGLSTYAEVQLLSYPLFLAGNLKVWWVVYLTEGVAITALLLLPRIAALHSHYWMSTAAIATLALSAIIIATSAFPDPYFNQHSSYVVIFITSIIYGIGGLRLLPAAAACWLSALLSWAVIWMFDLWMDWGLYAQYVVLANLVGMLICYALERRDRLMFLQSRLLELEKGKLDQFARELTRLSREDVLTGLANRRHFNEMFQVEWDRARREQQWLALIFVDIDHFKPFNDTHGHLEGDRVLSEVGTALRGSLRRPGDMAARYGGEEFVLLLPATPMSGALEVAAQVRQSIEALEILHRASSVADHLTASVGVAALIPTSEMRSAQLIARADEAVYAAKAAGRNRIMVAETEGFVPA